MKDVNPNRRRWVQRRDSARAARAERTREALVLAARELFAERGFHAVGVREITDRAGVSRGALSHHFADKEALFVAVFELVERELNEEAQARLGEIGADDPWALLRAGVRHYLDAAASRDDVRRITLIDGPVVLGWARWRKLEEDFSLGAFSAALEAAMATGRIRKRPVEPLAHLIVGSVMETAMLIANSNDHEKRRREVGQALDDLLAGLE